MNKQAVTQVIHAFLSHGDGFEQACKDAIKLFKGVSREKAKAVICPLVSEYYTSKGKTDCAFTDGKWEHPMCAAKTKANRLLKVIEGSSSPESSAKTVVDVPRGVVEAIQAALEGLTKAQVAEALQRAKNGLSFE
jgi:hypothetical protein